MTPRLLAWWSPPPQSPPRARALAARHRLAHRSAPIVRRGHARAASNGLQTPDILRAPTKHHRRNSMPQHRRRRHGPQPDRRRALELLASCNGATEAIMLAHGFTVEQMVDLCIAGLAIATPEHMVAGERTFEVVRMTITEAGRRALAEQ